MGGGGTRDILIISTPADRPSFRLLLGVGLDSSFASLRRTTLLHRGELRVQTMNRGFAWLDRGTHDSLAEATIFIEVIEKRQGLKIAYLEEIAFLQGWIDEQRIRNSPGRWLSLIVANANIASGLVSTVHFMYPLAVALSIGSALPRSEGNLGATGGGAVTGMAAAAVSVFTTEATSSGCGKTARRSWIRPY